MWRVYYDDSVTCQPTDGGMLNPYGVLCILQCVDGVYNIGVIDQVDDAGDPAAVAIDKYLPVRSNHPDRIGVVP